MVALGVIDALDCELAPVDKRASQLRAPPDRRSGAAGPLRDRRADLVAILAELGDVRRFSSSARSVRYAGMDITVHASDDAAPRPPFPPRTAGLALGAL